jgi:hypothetical protein
MKPFRKPVVDCQHGDTTVEDLPGNASGIDIRHAPILGGCAVLSRVVASPPVRKQTIPLFNLSEVSVRMRHCLGGGRGRRVVAALSILIAPLSFAATALFPKPLHLVRRVDDPIAKTTATIDEYCAGNRVVTVRGAKVAIADYDAQQLTEIDHAAQTWSVTPFADIARSRTDLDVRIGNKTAASEAKVTALGRTASGDGYVVSYAHRRTQVAFNRNIALSRAAAEVLIGAAYPNVRNSEADGILSAAGGNGTVSAMSTGSVATYGLLVERTLTVEDGGTTLVSRNEVVRVGEETPPADLMIIEPGAKRVESRLTRLARELRDIDTIPSAKTQH